MKSKTSRFVLIALSVVFLILTGCSDRATKAEIFALVEENRSTIIENIQTCQLDNGKKISIVKETTPHDGYIDFYCGGSGMGGQTSYCGFYYFENDELENVQACLGKLIAGDHGVTFVPHGDGYVWEENDGDNMLYFEKIADHFYYYEQKF